MLALVTRFDVGFDLWAKAIPCEGLVNGIDSLSDPSVAKVGAVLVDDALLEVRWNNNFVVDRVYCDVAKGDFADSVLVGWSLE